MDCNLPGSSVLGIFQTRVLEWVAISFSRGSSRPSDRTQVSRIAGRRLTVWATREATYCTLRCKHVTPLFQILKWNPTTYPRLLATTGLHGTSNFPTFNQTEHSKCTHHQASSSTYSPWNVLLHICLEDIYSTLMFLFKDFPDAIMRSCHICLYITLYLYMYIYTHIKIYVYILFLPFWD